MTLTTKLVASAGFLALLTGLATAVPTSSAQAQAATIGGNNPMKNEKSTSNPNLPHSQGQAAAIGGNNPMKNEKSTAAGANEQGTRSVTNTRASRGSRRGTTGAGARR